MSTKIASTPSEWKEYANQNTKYTILIKILRQLKYQVCHLYEKNTPTKTISTPSEWKEYANQNNKYAIWMERIRQPKQ